MSLPKDALRRKAQFQVALALNGFSMLLATSPYVSALVLCSGGNAIDGAAAAASFFNPRAPSLKDINKTSTIEEVEVVKAFLKLCINEGILKQVSRGAEGVGSVELMVASLLELVRPHKLRVSSSLVWTLAVEEVSITCNALLAMTTKVPTDKEMAAVKALAASQSGSHASLVKHLISQVAFWGNAERM
eukprot:31310-Amphidinium_carterae.2